MFCLPFVPSFCVDILLVVICEYSESFTSSDIRVSTAAVYSNPSEELRKDFTPEASTIFILSILNLEIDITAKKNRRNAIKKYKGLQSIRRLIQGKDITNPGVPVPFPSGQVGTSNQSIRLHS